MIEKVDGERVITQATILDLKRSAELNGAEVTEQNVEGLRQYYRLNEPLEKPVIVTSSTETSNS